MLNNYSFIGKLIFLKILNITNGLSDFLISNTLVYSLNNNLFILTLKTSVCGNISWFADIITGTLENWVGSLNFALAYVVSPARNVFKSCKNEEWYSASSQYAIRLFITLLNGKLTPKFNIFNVI